MQDLRRRARQRIEPCGLQLAQIGCHVQPQRLCSLPDFQGRKRVDMHTGGCTAHGGQNIEIGLPGVIRMNTALHTDFSGSALPGLDTPPGDSFSTDIVGTAAQVFTQLALGERTELAFEVTDIGVVDIAIDHIANGIAAALSPQLIGLADKVSEVISPAVEQPRYVALVQCSNVAAAGDDLAYVCRNRV